MKELRRKIQDQTRPSDLIPFKHEFDPNEMDESDRQPEKHDEPGITIDN
jgi:hypothetical protein